MEIFLEVAINNLENQSVEAQLLDPNEEIKEDDSEISKTFKKIYLKLSKQDFNLFLQINLFNHMNVIAEKIWSANLPLTCKLNTQKKKIMNY